MTLVLAEHIAANIFPFRGKRGTKRSPVDASCYESMSNDSSNHEVRAIFNMTGRRCRHIMKLATPIENAGHNLASPPQHGRTLFAEAYSLLAPVFVPSRM
jgi:hypothetical protein